MLFTWENIDPEKSPHLVTFLSLFTSEQQTPLPVISEVTLHDDWPEIFVHVSLYRINRETRNSHMVIPALCFHFSHTVLTPFSPVKLTLFPETASWFLFSPPPTLLHIYPISTHIK